MMVGQWSDVLLLAEVPQRTDELTDSINYSVLRVADRNQCHS